MSKFFYYSTPRRVGGSLFQCLFKEAEEKGIEFSTYIIKERMDAFFRNPLEKTEPIFFGVDWAKDSGLNRGDVIKQIGNVTYVRFKTCG